MITGTLNYRNIDFIFVLEESELHLIPPDEKKEEIKYRWIMKELSSGVYTTADPIVVTEKSIIGTCNETGKRIVFLPKVGSWISFHNQIIIIELDAYIEFSTGADKIDKVEFCCTELNYIYPVNQGLTFNLPTEDSKMKGRIGVYTKDFDYTTSDEQVFIVADKKIRMNYGISRVIRFGIVQQPLTLTSSLVFTFEETDDYRFLLNLHKYARAFIMFLCYRRNIYFSEVILSSPYNDSTHLNAAKMIVLNNRGETEEAPLKKGCYIKQTYVSGIESGIFNDLVSDKLYLRHLPTSYESGLHKDEARFVMITAAFEWEFRRLYPEGVKKSLKTINAEKEVDDQLQELMKVSAGKKRSIYRNIIKNFKSDSLKNEIIYAGKELGPIIDVFGNQLYSLNGEVLKYSEIGERLSQQRNSFAHGKLDKDFIGLSLLDLIYLEMIIYAMQLKYYGVEDKLIQKSINKLFNQNILID